MSNLILAIAGIMSLFAAANANATTILPPLPLKIERHIQCGHLTHGNAPKLYIFRSQQELDDARMAHLGEGVDFEKQSIIVVADGAKNTTGYSVLITDVLLSADGDVAHVHVRRTTPGGRMVGQAFTWPHDAVVVPKLAEHVKPVFQTLLKRRPVKILRQNSVLLFGQYHYPVLI